METTLLSGCFVVNFTAPFVLLLLTFQVLLLLGDQMLAVGFEEAVKSILENLPQKRQSMLFSETMPSWVKKLARKYLDNPLNICLVKDFRFLTSLFLLDQMLKAIFLYVFTGLVGWRPR